MSTKHTTMHTQKSKRNSSKTRGVEIIRNHSQHFDEMNGTRSPKRYNFAGKNTRNTQGKKYNYFFSKNSIVQIIKT